jgi:hypothetical protein
MASSLNPVNLLQQWSGASAAVVNAIKGASAKTGVSFDYLMNKAKQESSFNPTAKANTSSATGLFQFIDSTWLGAVKDYGSKFGLSNLSDQISVDSNGHPQVSDDATKQKILDLRNDPTVAANITAAMTQDNASYLQNSLGGKVGETDLYLAHFLGLGGADKFLKARQANPTQAAADLFPAAADANKTVFYDASGRKKSLDDVYNYFSTKMDPADSGAPVTLVAAGNNKTPSTAFANNGGYSTLRVSEQVDATTAKSIAQRQYLETMLAGINNFGKIAGTDSSAIGNKASSHLLSPYTSYILAKMKLPGDVSSAEQIPA